MDNPLQGTTSWYITTNLQSIAERGGPHSFRIMVRSIEGLPLHQKSLSRR
jgi:hypothetical protein